MLTVAHQKLIDLDRKKEEVKKFFEEYSNAVQELIKQEGLNHAFQDPFGTVYQLVELDGRWVQFDRFGVERTRRQGEVKGSMSLKKARELGFKVEGE